MVETYIKDGVKITRSVINGIVTESPYVNYEGVVFESLERRYSDNGKKMLQVETGRLYDDAVDVKPCRYTYIETDGPIDPVYPTDKEYIEAAKIMLGEVD